MGNRTPLVSPIADGVLFKNMLSTQAIKDFQKIYKNAYGITLTDSEALDLASNLLSVFKVVYKPIKYEWGKDETKEKK
jgi:hypothetical protein